MSTFSEKDKLEVYYPHQLPPELVRQAQLVVCGRAIDVEDAAMLLDVLNLKGPN